MEHSPVLTPLSIKQIDHEVTAFFDTHRLSLRGETIESVYQAAYKYLENKGWVYGWFVELEPENPGYAPPGSRILYGRLITTLH